MYESLVLLTLQINQVFEEAEDYLGVIITDGIHSTEQSLSHTKGNTMGD